MNSDYTWALGIVVVYLLLCWYFLIRGRKTQIIMRPPENGGHVLVAYASQGGKAKDLAKQYANSLQNKSRVLLLSLNQIKHEHINSAAMALFVVSTYGEGEPPDNALKFYQKWLRKPVSDALSNLRFAVLALGDSEYRNFCSFGVSLSTHLVKHGANQIFETVTVDSMDVEHLSTWEQQLHTHGLIECTDMFTTLKQDEFKVGLLTRQDCINSGSPGAPVYHLSIAPPEEMHWQAGDIVEIQFQQEDKQEPELREYSIASLEEDGSLDLLVRQVKKEDDGFGLGSGWLTREANIGSKLMMNVRSNVAFHAPPIENPMILIGNGTGLAGLRAHLKARVLVNSKQNCLFFGERTHAHDLFFRDEIIEWKKQGCLTEVYLAFSRDQEEKRYVQDLVVEQKNLIKDWVSRGASIYICGSLEGMGSGVEKALQKILGVERFQQMKVDGSYARDVY